MQNKKLEDRLEIINLEAIKHLPKATEHFISDLHGEYEAFEHILRNGSGSIREKVRILFRDSLSEAEQSELCFIIYYPEELLPQQKAEDWFPLLERLVKVARFSAGKYTRSKVRKATPKEFSYILEELLYQYDEEYNKEWYYGAIFQKIIELDLAEDFCLTLAQLIHRLVVDHLHVLGDIYDRGPSPDKIMDRLMSFPSLDIQLGNHDILWIGSFCGSLPCLTNTLRIAARYGNMGLLENYGIDLSKARAFSQKYYRQNDAFYPKVEAGELSESENEEGMLLQQAFTIMQMKVEGQVIKRRPDFHLDDRLFLDCLKSDTKINYFGKERRLVNSCFQLVGESPYELSGEEEEVLLDLLRQFQQSSKLRKHVQFLVEKGQLYLTYNDNLLFHGCIPCEENGDFMEITIDGQGYAGKELMDFFMECIQKSFQNPENHEDLATDMIWYLWCGEGSSLFGKKAMKTFERYFLKNKTTHKEEKNAYYRLRKDEEFCEKMLQAFGLEGSGHVINGHTPVKVRKGETPIKANGKLLVIDGGLSKPYQKVTGIAGYTLLSSSFGMTLVAHQAFTNREEAIEKRQDILCQREIVVRKSQRIFVKETDIGQQLDQQIKILKENLS